MVDAKSNVATKSGGNVNLVACKPIVLGTEFLVAHGGLQCVNRTRELLISVAPGMCLSRLLFGCLVTHLSFGASRMMSPGYLKNRAVVSCDRQKKS